MKGPSANRVAIYRLMVILGELRATRAGRPVNCRSLAESLEVSAKTVSRDLEFLRDSMAVPIEYNPVERGFTLAGEVTGSFFDVAKAATVRWKEAA